MKPRKVIIMGAAGRDFHNFNVFFRDNHDYNVVCFTAEQIPGIAGRKYPKELAGKLYPGGIPIFPESRLPGLIAKHGIDEVVLAYSDLSHLEVMHKASTVLGCGASFRFLGPNDTMLKSKKPVIAVCAVRTGCGKSPTTRKIAKILKRRGKGVVVVRHPMPYGDLKEQTCQRFATMRDLDEQKATIEEREEYEPLIEDGLVVYAGVDYKKILDAAEKEADIIIWDGGNNDFPFFRPDLLIVLCDARRAGHEISYHPGETNLRMADVIVINKVRTAGKSEVKTIMANAKDCNPKAKIILADMPKTVDSPEKIRNKKVLVIEDGPTLTHGGLDYGAGYLAAKACNAKPVSPLPFAVGTIKATFRKYPHLKLVLPAMGYSKKQMKELEETINRARCDAVVIGTPVDLRKHLKLSKPAVRVTYSLEEIGRPKLEEVLKAFM